MAKSTRQYVFEGMELLPEALIPFVEKRLESSLTGHWQVKVLEKLPNLKPNGNGDVGWDQSALFNAMDRFWAEAFRSVLGRAERSMVNELVDVRNKLSHNEAFTYDDAERALDSMRRLMEAISAGGVAEQIGKMRDTILRTKFTELQRNEERRKTQRSDISVETVSGLLPWREVVEPHQDVATGEFQQAEFAADLAKVHNGSAPSEYRNPTEFFARTYLTEGLSNLLLGAANRLSGGGGDPVVELQTNFGGGKTHSMLALYHMASGTAVQELPGLDQLLSGDGLTVPKKVNRAVLVGTSRGPQDIVSLEGGRKIRTTWGELAWQLGGAEGFDMLAENDERGIAPGSNLLEAIFKKFSPSLILIDEWVAYPIHPELFDQLYTSWGSLEKFQRTRGVLRLMAQVIHELWMGNDPSVMIMPGSVAISTARVEPELLHYLDVSWQAIIAGDVDGGASTPYKIDQSAPNLNRYSATRRVARAIFMGTAPTAGQENKGLDDKQINLGVVQPGERPSIFGDALRRLTNQSKFMHSDLGRYWYSMSASLNRVAADRAGQFEEALVLMEIDKALVTYINGLADRGHFDAVQIAPGSSSDVPDEAGGVRAVVLGVAHAHTGREGSEALTEAKDVLLQRGSTPRVYRNMLVFLAAEHRQLNNLKDAQRSALAWAEIVRETDRLNLTQSDSALAKAKLTEANETLKTRLKEAWCYLLYPVQESAQAELEWTSAKVPAQDGLLARATKKLVSDEGLLSELGPARLDRELQKYIWNGKDHLFLKDLWEYLNRYTYLPRLKNRAVLAKTVQSAIGGMLPGPFAYAERWDETKQTYAGLAISGASHVQVVIDSDSVIVKPDVAEAHRPKPSPMPDNEGGTRPIVGGETEPGSDDGREGRTSTADEKLPTRFVGTVMISAERPAREIHQIVEAIVEQLTTIPGSDVSLKLEIDAEVPTGFDRAKVRTLTENATTLGFIDKVIK
jgi:hypothetical protein